MKQEYAQKLSEALRSGKYRKGTLALRRADTNCFCILGVLADIVAPDKWQISETHPHLYSVVAEDEQPIPQRTGMLPRSMLDAVGLNDIGANKMTYVNDNSCMTFPQMADWLDENWRHL